MSESMEQSIRNHIPDAVLESSVVDNVLTLKVSAGRLVDLCRYLKSSPDMDFDYPADVTAVDWSDRIEMVYHLYSMKHDQKIRLKVDLDREKPVVPSLIDIWSGVNWPEREVFDLFGVNFEGHPDLRRILLPEDFEGYPLRKDYVIPD